MTVFLINDTWALAADNVQWILQRRRNGPHPWYGVSFVSSTKEVLARCMEENGIPPDDANAALERLPNTFREWQRSHLQLDTAARAPNVSVALSPAQKSLLQETPAL